MKPGKNSIEDSCKLIEHQTFDFLWPVKLLVDCFTNTRSQNRRLNQERAERNTQDVNENLRMVSVHRVCRKTNAGTQDGEVCASCSHHTFLCDVIFEVLEDLLYKPVTYTGKRASPWKQVAVPEARPGRDGGHGKAWDIGSGETHRAAGHRRPRGQGAQQSVREAAAPRNPGKRRQADIINFEGDVHQPV